MRAPPAGDENRARIQCAPYDLFTIVLHHQMDAVLFFEGKLAVSVYQTNLVGVELENWNAFGLRLGFAVADKKNHGGVEEVDHLDQGHNSCLT